MKKFLSYHEQHMERLLDRLAAPPKSKHSAIHLPRGVTLWVGKKNRPEDNWYSCRLAIRSRGRTGAGDRLALIRILAKRKRTVIHVHKGWLE